MIPRSSCLRSLKHSDWTFFGRGEWVENRELIQGQDEPAYKVGKVSIGAGPDPLWQKRARFPKRRLTVPAQSYINIHLTIQVPRRLAPNLYFIGFLVTPVATQAGGLEVINQIGSFVTIDVPGPRVRKLAGVFEMPSFVLGSHVSGTMRITNIGHAAVRFWGEDDTTSSPGGENLIALERRLVTT